MTISEIRRACGHFDKLCSTMVDGENTNHQVAKVSESATRFTTANFTSSGVAFAQLAYRRAELLLQRLPEGTQIPRAMTEFMQALDAAIARSMA